MPLKNKRVLVTGGAGFIGCHLVDCLMELGNEITVVDDLSASTTEYIENYMNNTGFEFIKGDIRDKTIMQETCREKDIVFHFAANPDVRLSVNEPYFDFESNVLGTFNLLEAMRKNDVKTLIFASSGGTIYGDAEVYPTPESHILMPISTYGASKASCEMFISAYSACYGISSVSLRYANIYGPRSLHGVMHDFFWKLRETPEELVILGDGKQNKSYMYISDCITATMKITEYITSSEKNYDTFNVGVSDQIEVRKIAEIITNELKLDDVQFSYTGGEKGWVGDVHRMLLDTTKLEKLGFRPEVNLEEGIRMYIRWLKERFGWP
ncbi:MAG: GDP-mannose 4,6-dehydratase [Promethearchaeota archaeon]